MDKRGIGLKIPPHHDCKIYTDFKKQLRIVCLVTKKRLRVFTEAPFSI